jgi:2-C-methyl-D-erythritol 4-phosphate cytidylyltransferase
VEGASRFGGCVPGLHLRETTKEVNQERRVVRTIDRERLWSIQTPQAFQKDLLGTALMRAREDHFTGTDEAMLVERIGGTVKVIEGNTFNIKITTPEDLKLAQLISTLLTQETNRKI